MRVQRWLVVVSGVMTAVVMSIKGGWHLLVGLVAVKWSGCGVWNK